MIRIKFFTAVILFSAMMYGQESFVNIGEEVPQFTFKDENGSSYNIQDLKGQNILIVFFATWCGPCLMELPHVEEKVWERYKNRSDFKLMIIGREHTMAELKRFKEKKGYQMPFYADEDRAIFSKFAPSSIPRSYLIDKKGKIHYSSIGFSEPSFNKLVEKIDGLLQNN